MSHKVVSETRVRFAEADLQGVVFYGNYFTYLDEAFYEYIRDIGYPNSKLKEEGWDVHVVNTEMDYRRPAEFEDIVRHAFNIDSFSNSSMTGKYTAKSVEDEIFAEGSIVYVTVDRESGDSISVPEDFKAAVGADRTDN